MRRQDLQSPVSLSDQAQDQAPPTSQELSLITSENEHGLLSNKKKIPLATPPLSDQVQPPPLQPLDQAPPTSHGFSLTTLETAHGQLLNKKDMSPIVEFEPPTNELSSPNNVSG